MHEMKKIIMKYKGFSAHFPVFTTKTDSPYERASWTRDLKKRDRRVKEWKEDHPWYDGRAEHFALSKAYMDVDYDKDKAWEVRLSLFRA